MGGHAWCCSTWPSAVGWVVWPPVRMGRIALWRGCSCPTFRLSCRNILIGFAGTPSTWMGATPLSLLIPWLSGRWLRGCRTGLCSILLLGLRVVPCWLLRLGGGLRLWMFLRSRLSCWWERLGGVGSTGSSRLCTAILQCGGLRVASLLFCALGFGSGRFLMRLWRRWSRVGCWGGRRSLLGLGRFGLGCLFGGVWGTGSLLHCFRMGSLFWSSGIFPTSSVVCSLGVSRDLNEMAVRPSGLML